MKARIRYLDGQRGLAILLVVFFHAYARWPELVPYHGAYAAFPVFKYGWVGVELFFLVSGFVILMTLENCRSAGEFLLRRWLRLFPAMLVCSLFIYLTAGFFVERPDGAPLPASLIPGLTFIEPSWWQNMLGIGVKPLEGGYWSLYVEAKFYVFAAVVYFLAGRNWLIGALTGVFVFGTACKLADALIGGATFAAMNNVCRNLSLEYFGWFAAGAAFYVYAKTSKMRWLAGGIALALLSAAFVRTLHWQSAVVTAFVALFFAASLVSPLLQRVLEHRIFQFFGFVSYPLYLLQENLMISTIVKLGTANIGLPLWVYPVVPIALLSAAAYAVARYIEPNLKQVLAAVILKRAPRRAA